MTTKDHPTASITPPKSDIGQNGRFGSEWVAVFIGMRKKFENHVHMVALYTVFYNYCRIHKTLRVTPAMEPGLSDTVRDLEWIAELIDARAPKPGRPKTYKKRNSN